VILKIYIKAKAYNTYIVPQAAFAAAARLWCQIIYLVCGGSVCVCEQLAEGPSWQCRGDLQLRV